jgi:hypothetical protein
VHAGENSPEAMATDLRLAYLGGALVELAGAAALAFIRADSMERRKSPAMQSFLQRDGDAGF